MSAFPSRMAPPSTSAEIANCVDRFDREGLVLLPNVLKADEVAELLAGIQRVFEEPDPRDSSSAIIRDVMFLRGTPFETIIDRPPIIDLVEAILGADCHVIAENGIRTRPHEGLDRWHVDETVHFPRSREIPIDNRILMPCFVVQAMYYLVDVDEQLGPTQFVPTSHRSGREPDRSLTYEGHGPVSVLAHAGDCALLNGQTWHRGATNLSKDRTRYVHQVVYGRRFMAQRFFPFESFQIPEELLARSPERRRRLLGVHPRGPFSRSTYS